MKISLKDGAIIAGTWAASLALVHKLCDLIFRCGCTWAWAGADRHCNVHHASPPHCPWCSHGWAGFLWVPALLILAEAGVVLALRKRGALAQILGAGAVYLGLGAAAGLLSALLDGYPHWLGIALR